MVPSEEGYETNLLSADITSSDKEIITGDGNGNIGFWKYETDKSRWVRTHSINKAHDGMIKELKYYDKSDTFLSLSNDNTVKLWNHKSRECQLTIPYFPGLFIKGCNLQKTTMELNDHQLYLLYIYGAKLSPEKEQKALEYYKRYQSSNVNRVT